MTITTLLAAMLMTQSQAAPAPGNPPALTAQEKQQLGSMFKAIDVDGSGRISKTEMSAFGLKFGFSGIVATKGWAILDQNRDGSLTQEEFARGMAQFRQMALTNGRKN